MLLMKMNFPWQDRLTWILPGGGIKSGEAPADALRRELLEETGYNLEEVPQPIGQGQEPYPDAGITLAHTFYLLNVEPFAAQPVQLEAREAEWFVDFHWWEVDALRQTDELILPGNLVTGMDTALSGGSNIEFR